MTDMIDRITTLEKISLSENDVLVIHIDIGNLPVSLAHKYMNDIKDTFQLLFLSQRIVTVPSTTTFTVLSKESVSENA